MGGRRGRNKRAEVEILPRVDIGDVGAWYRSTGEDVLVGILVS